jgi:hypothetical protein
MKGCEVAFVNVQTHLMNHRPLRLKKSQNLVQLTQSDYASDIAELE